MSLASEVYFAVCAAGAALTLAESELWFGAIDEAIG